MLHCCMITFKMHPSKYRGTNDFLPLAHMLCPVLSLRGRRGHTATEQVFVRQSREEGFTCSGRERSCAQY